LIGNLTLNTSRQSRRDTKALAADGKATPENHLKSPITGNTLRKNTKRNEKKEVNNSILSLEEFF